MKRRIVACALVLSLLVGIHVVYADPGDSRRLINRKPVATYDGEFTFCRIRFTSTDDDPRYMGRWAIDWPESERHFSQRLTELTTIRVPRDETGEFKAVVLRLTDEEIYDYPFLYMLEVGFLRFTEEERDALRDYLLRGGFLMVDDFWGDTEWNNWEAELARVFPPDEYPIVDLPISHPIFHIVFDLKEKPQIPAEYVWRTFRTTWEPDDPRFGKFNTKEPNFRAIFDKNGRMMMIICHNTDLGDGWEREGENPDYFQRFSAKLAYPMGINIVVYALTH